MLKLHLWAVGNARQGKSKEHPRQLIFQINEIYSMDIQCIISLPILLKFPTLYRWNMMNNVYQNTVIMTIADLHNILSAVAKLLFFAFTTQWFSLSFMYCFLFSFLNNYMNCLWAHHKIVRFYLLIIIFAFVCKVSNFCTNKEEKLPFLCKYWYIFPIKSKNLSNETPIFIYFYPPYLLPNIPCLHISFNLRFT